MRSGLRALLALTLGLALVGLPACTRDLQTAGRSRARAQGPKAPVLRLVAPDGDSRELVPGARFEVTVVSFFSPTWNPDNASHLAELQKLARRKANQPLRILLVAYDEEPDRLRKYLAAHPQEAEVAVGDEPTYEAWEVKALPTTVLVAPDGATIERIEGQVSADRLWEKIAPFFPE